MTLPKNLTSRKPYEARFGRGIGKQHVPRRFKLGRVGVALGATVALTATGVVAAVAVAPPPAHNNHTVGLAKVGPIDETTGFPVSYTDTNGTRLEMCTEVANPNCIVGPLPTPGQPVSFPSNYPGEAFYSAANATIDAGNGNKALLTTGTEASFAGGTAKVGQQITFGRIRVRVSGLVDNGAYKVTHPFGTDNYVSQPGAARGINNTEDIGSLSPDGVFDQTLAAREAPFLKWDATGPAAPAGYLGDPTVNHAVTGSPYNTNIFRVEGPAGSFPGSTQQCADPTLGQSNTATDDCIETNLFQVQGKLATRAGVQVMKAIYQNRDTGHVMDLFAKSEPGQQLMVTGTGISQTPMRGDAKGNYFARVYADGAPPVDLTVTNTTDKPASVDHVAQSLFGDNVHISSAVYNTDSQTFQVTGQSGDPSSNLTLTGYPGVAPMVDSAGNSTWSVPNVPVPPSDAIVTTNKGGVGSSDVVVTGGEFASAQVKAAIQGSANAVQIGAPVSLDSTLSTGTVTSSAWAITSGPAGAALSSTTAPGTTFTATTAGTYTVQLTVTGSGGNNTSTDTYVITVSGATAVPVADAGPDQTGIIPTSTVTLDGTNSKFAKTFAWSQPAGQNVALNGPTTANPTFVMPATTTPTTYVFTLTITDTDGTAVSDSVNVISAPGVIATPDSATYKAGSLEWRVRGNTQYCSANNLLTFSWKKSDGTFVQIGTATPALALGVCSYDFRLRNTPTALRPTSAGVISIKSALGGYIPSTPFQLL
jgi:hypothetical protein